MEDITDFSEDTIRTILNQKTKKQLEVEYVTRAGEAASLDELAALMREMALELTGRSKTGKPVGVVKLAESMKLAFDRKHAASSSATPARATATEKPLSPKLAAHVNMMWIDWEGNVMVRFGFLDGVATTIECMMTEIMKGLNDGSLAMHEIFQEIGQYSQALLQGVMRAIAGRLEMAACKIHYDMDELPWQINRHSGAGKTFWSKPTGTGLRLPTVAEVVRHDSERKRREKGRE